MNKHDKTHVNNHVVPIQSNWSISELNYNLIPTRSLVQSLIRIQSRAQTQAHVNELRSSWSICHRLQRNCRAHLQKLTSIVKYLTLSIEY